MSRPARSRSLPQNYTLGCDKASEVVSPALCLVPAVSSFRGYNTTQHQGSLLVGALMFSQSLLLFSQEMILGHLSCLLVLGDAFGGRGLAVTLNFSIL